MKPFFKDVLEYTFVFNNKVIESMMFLENAPQKSIKLINHIINAQEIWNSRIEIIQTTRGVWDIRKLEELKEANEVNHQKSLSIVDKNDFDKKITYRNTQGKAFTNTIGEMLFHVINHSTYHRGQIATDFKLNGKEPLITDYIFYKRTEI